MRGAPDNSTKVQGAGELWVKWIGYIVLLKFTRAPAGHVEKTVVQGKINVGNERRHGLKTLQHGREFVRIGRLRGNFDHFFDGPLAVVSIPKPNRSRQVLQR